MASRLFKFIKELIKGKIYNNRIIILSGIFIIFINPALGFFTPRCLFKEMTGFYCAGCGMTTGFYALLRADFYGAVERNLLIVTLMPVAAIYIIVRRIFLFRNHKRNCRYDKFIIFMFIIAVLIFTVCRNVKNPVFDILRPH